MLTWIREKFGTVLISVIIGGIAFVFAFYGVLNPKSTRGLHEGAVAGTVNGDAISIAEFQRAYRQQLEMFKSMGGGKITDEQLKMFHIKQRVFQDLVRRRLMIQEASSEGFEPADEQVRQKIRDIPAFQKDGKFDLDTYRQVLAANNHTPGSFEHLVREDLSLQLWEEYFKGMVHVSDDELHKNFVAQEEKRDIKYVLLTPDAAAKGVRVAPAEIAKYLADPAKLNLVRSQYNARKEKDFKGKAFDAVKASIAESILASSKTEEVRKLNAKLAGEVTERLGAAKGADAKLNAFLKPYGLTVRTTGMISRENTYVPGLGEASDLVKDAFAPGAAVGQAAKPKTYALPSGTLVALLIEAKRADLADFAKRKPKLAEQALSHKERDVYEAWMKKLFDKAKIDPNPAVLSDESEG